jgi:hypothetical protein
VEAARSRNTAAGRRANRAHGARVSHRTAAKSSPAASDPAADTVISSIRLTGFDRISIGGNFWA